MVCIIEIKNAAEHLAQQRSFYFIPSILTFQLLICQKANS